MKFGKFYFCLATTLMQTLVANATSPEFLGTVYAGGRGNKSPVRFRNDTAYFVNSYSLPANVGILDVSSPESPKFVGTVSCGATSGESILSEIYDNFLYSSNRNDASIGVLSLSQNKADLVGTVSSGGFDPRAMVFNKITGYVPNRDSNSIGYLDLSNPASPRLLGTISSGGVAPFKILLNGTTGYVLNEYTFGTLGNIGVIDVTRDGEATLIGTVSSAGTNPRNMVMSENSLYIVHNSDPGILSAFDISSPGIPTLKGTVNTTAGYPNTIFVNGNYGYVSNQVPSNFAIVNLETINQSSLIGTISTAGLYPQQNMFKAGNVLYVANYFDANNETANAPIAFFNLDNPSAPRLLGTIASGSSGLDGLTQYGAIGYSSIFDSNLSTNLGYFSTYPLTITVPAGSGNAGVVASVINNLVASGNCPPAILSLYYKITTLPVAQQVAVLNQIAPQFKVAQFALEKLDFLLHKELESVLYGDQTGVYGFVIAGYDHFKQGAHDGYSSYNVDNYYQLVGLTHDWGCMKWLAGLGATESYMTLNPYSSHASYPSVWGTLGVSSASDRWHYGLDALFGYSFLHTSRNIPVISEKATSNHGAWNLSADAKIGYKFQVQDVQLMPYDNLSYLYGQENHYQEHGASGYNQMVKNEHISVIRNTLGMSLVADKKKYLGFFVDGAWVYDYYMNNNAYSASIEGTNIWSTYRQTTPTKNYGRVNTGFMGTHNSWDWKLAYTGLYGKRLLDNAISLKMGYKF